MFGGLANVVVERLGWRAFPEARGSGVQDQLSRYLQLDNTIHMQSQN